MLLRQRPSCAQAILCSLAVLVSPMLCPRPAPGQYSPVNSTGPSSNRVDIVFMGDGYTSGQIPAYWNDVQTLFAYLFGPPPPPIAPIPGQPPPPINFDPYERDPYVQYRNFFNTWRVDVVSAQSGADDPSTNTWVNTALNASYAFGGGPQRLLYIDSALGYATLTQALQTAPFAAEVRPVVVNDVQYGGGGGYGDFAVYAARDPFNTRIALHELGHAFNWLGDEYQSTLPYVGPEPWEVNVTTDQTGAKWAPWLGYPDVPAVGTIGVYQGGYGSYQTGIWRPSLDSKMRNLGYWSSSPGYPNAVYGVPFNAICREKIILDIYGLVDPLDAWTPNSAPLTDPSSLSVTPIDPNVIQVAWYIDGTLVSSTSGPSFQIQNLVGNLGAGRYTVAARAYDPTPWVVRNRSELEQTVTWDVRLTGTGGASQWALPADSQWSIPGNWTGPVPNGVDAGASFLDAPPGPRTVTIDVPVTVGTLNLDNANAYTLAGASQITMQASGGPAIVNVAGGSHTITAPVSLASGTNFNVWSGALALSGPVSGGGGLNKVGGGLLTLDGPNTYNGPTVISGGALRANSGAGLPTESSLTLAGPVPSNLTSTLGDGVLEGIGNTTFTRGLGAGPDQVQWTGSGGFSASGGVMTVNIGGNPIIPQTLNWGWGGFVPSGSALVFGSSTANNATFLWNPINLNGGTETVTVLDNPNTGADFATLAGAVSNGSLTKDGPGTLFLTAANTYQLYGGLTTVNAGTLAYGNPNALDYGRVIVNGGTFDVGAYTAIVGTVTLNGGSITGTTGLLYTTWNPNWPVSELRSGTISAILGGYDSLYKTDPYGTVALTGANTYAGTTYIYGGALQANSGAGLPITSNLVLTGGVLEGIGNATFTRSLGQGADQVQWAGSGGFSASGGVMTVDIGGPAQTLTWGEQYFVTNTGPTPGGLVFGSLTADNETRLLNPIDMNGQDCPVIVNDNYNTPADFATLAGVLSDSGPPSSSSLTKLGPGTLVLSAANTYGTPTYIEGGALQANSGAGLPTASNLVLADGVLEGIGDGTFTRALGAGPDQVQWTGSGGFSAYGGRMTVNIGGSPIPNTLTWAQPSSYFIPADGWLILGSPTANEETVFLNPIDLNGAIRGVGVDDNPTTAADFATLSGGVFNGGLIKGGPGTLVLPTVNGYAGGTTVEGGTLRAYGGALGTGPVVLLSGLDGVPPTLDLVGQVGVQPGLVAEFYTGNFGAQGSAIMTTPGGAGWDPYTPAWTGVVPYADFPVGPVGADYGNPFRNYTAFQTDNLSARVRGFINIPVSGAYRFHSGSDDGSIVWIRDDAGNWATACGNDNWQQFPGYNPDGVSIWLSAGYHEIAGGFYEGTGGAGWEMRWDAGLGTGFAGSPLPSAMAPYLVQVLPGGSSGFGNNVTVADDAAINVTGLVSMGSLTINAATALLSVTRGLGTTNAVTFTGTSLNGNVTIDSAADVDLGPVSDGATGAGLIKSGPGTLTLAPAGRSGATTLLSGTIALSASEALGTGPVTVSGGTLNVGGYTHTPGGVTLTGGLITGPAGGALATTGTFDMQSGTVRAALVGGALLIKTTPGTVVLTAANAYTGGTAVAEGTLRAYGGGLGSGWVLLGAGATLDLVGQMGILPGLVAQFYTGNFGGQGSAIMTTPGAAGWDPYTPAWTGVVPCADFPVGAVGADNDNPFRDYTPFQTDNLSARVTGYVYIPASGTYRFHSGSDDGSAVWVRDDLGNWVTACSNGDWQQFPGYRPSGSPIALSAGYHEIAGGFYEGGGAAGWELRWDAGLGTNFASSPPASALAPYLFQAVPGGSPYFGNAVAAAGDATIDVRGTAILGSLVIGGASTARLNVVDVDGLLVCEGTLAIAADCTLVKAGGGTATFDGPQTHGEDALFLVEDGTVNLNTDAGSATEANLDIEVIAGTVNFGSTQHLDELRVGADGLARITSGGSKVLVLNFLWIDTGTPLGVGGASQGLVPEPATLSLLALGGLAMLVRRVRRR